MMKSRLILIVMMIIPWFTLPLLGKRTIKRFYPAVIFISLTSEILHFFALRWNWWKFYSRIRPKTLRSIPFTLGPEFITAFWVLKWTYGNFPLFLLVDAIIHYIFAFHGIKWLKRQGIASLERLSPLQFFLLFTFRGFLLYSFEFVKETIFNKKMSR